MENRKQARIQISKEIKSNEERVKQAINSIAYGAPMKLREWFDAETNKNRKTAILSHLGKTSGELFIKNKNVVSLHKEMEECKKIILNHSPYTDNAPKKLKRNQIIAYVLQQNERELLEIMIEEIQKQQINILALKHDGIIIKSEMDARKVEKKILEKTGIKITLDRKEIV